MSRYFCTLFDVNYLIKGLTMLRSLKKYCADAEVYVLCMDKNTQSIIDALNLNFVITLPLESLEDESLLRAKTTRGTAEYCWTLSPCLPWYVMNNYKHVDFITYLDADLLFYSSVTPIFEEIGDASIAIIEHRFSERLIEREVNGRFCVEWVSFKRDDVGLKCLSRWRDQCIEWCYYRLEDGKMGDQKYLDEWPILYSDHCHIIENLGAGVAPWNFEAYTFSKDTNLTLTVNGNVLIFYHFHQFQILERGDFDRLSDIYTAVKNVPNELYCTYERAILDSLHMIRELDTGFSSGILPKSRVKSRRLVQKFVPMFVKNFARKFLRY